MRHPHVEARGMLLTDAEGHRHLNTPIRFAREPGRPVLRVPTLGEHTGLVAAVRNDA
jgi:crotonobetainyl-CoA:carnitine CoA-transferase CaiB-like acyl-CoA transferase